MVYLFYFVPYYVFAIYGLLYPNSQAWMKDWSLIHAGAAGQVHIKYPINTIDYICTCTRRFQTVLTKFEFCTIQICNLKKHFYKKLYMYW